MPSDNIKKSQDLLGKALMIAPLLDLSRLQSNFTVQIAFNSSKLTWSFKSLLNYISQDAAFQTHPWNHTNTDSLQHLNIQHLNIQHVPKEDIFSRLFYPGASLKFRSLWEKRGTEVEERL